jgi:hypothetical protein
VDGTAGAARRHLIGALAVGALAALAVVGVAAVRGDSTCSSSGACSGEGTALVRDRYSVTLDLGAGRQKRSFRIHEPRGVIRVYRVEAPRDTKVQGTARLPGVTVPLAIAADSTGPARDCVRTATRVTCTQGEEACPMPRGTWRVHLVKSSGPAGPVKLHLRVGPPRRRDS